MMQGVNLLSVTFRLTLAVICGGLIGYDRGRMRRAAGFRTHILVCLGSALAMMTNQYIFNTFHDGDVSRIGAQVISGIGFLGAGTIIVTSNQQVKGLTTAAGLWASACMGLAIGIGFYQGALIGCAFILCVVTVFHKLDDRFSRKSMVHDLYIEVDNITKVKTVLTYLRENTLKVFSCEINKVTDEEKDHMGAILTVRMMLRGDNQDLLQAIREIDGVTYLEELD